MKTFIILVLILISNLFASVGDISNVIINENGWNAQLLIEGVSSGGTFDFGLGTNNEITNAKVKFTVTRKKLNRDGGDTIYTQIVYGTKQLRKKYPNEAVDSVVVSNSDLIIYFALSEYIFIKDKSGTGNSGVDIKVNIDAGLYSNSNSLTNFTVVNNSLIDYPKPIARWTQPPRKCVTGDFNVAAYGIHYSVTNGQPIDHFRFTSKDEHNHFDTQYVYTPSFTFSNICSTSITEYIATIETNTFTVGDNISVNFDCYPIYGDKYLTTSDGVNTWPSPLYCTYNYKLVSDVKLAVVDIDTSNDNSGVVINNSSFDVLNPPVAFKTIAGAINSIRTSMSSSLVDGAIILLRGRSTEYPLYGSTITTGTSSNYWLNLENYPGERPKIGNKSGSPYLPTAGCVRIKGVEFVHSTGSMMTHERALWLDSCFDRRTDGTGLATQYDNDVNYVTNCSLFSRFDMPYTTTNQAGDIIRNNVFAQTTIGSIIPYTFIGNKNITNDIAAILTYKSGSSTVPNPTGGIVAFNMIHSNGTCMFSNWWVNIGDTVGYAFVGNLFEKKLSVAPALQFAADNSTLDSVNNILIINNTVVGERMNYAFNDTNLNSGSSTGAGRLCWAVKGNLFDRIGLITDFHPHTGVPNANRIGNWAVCFGVGHANNGYWTRPVHKSNFDGINIIDPDATFTNNSNYWSFVSNKSYTGDGLGYGNYRLKNTSNVKILSTDCYNTYDMNGWKRRLVNGAIGAYESNDTLGKKYGDGFNFNNSIISVPCSTLTKVNIDSIKIYFQTSLDKIDWSYKDSSEWKIPSSTVLKDTLSTNDLIADTKYYCRLVFKTNSLLGYIDSTTVDSVITSAGSTIDNIISCYPRNVRSDATATQRIITMKYSGNSKATINTIIHLGSVSLGQNKSFTDSTVVDTVYGCPSGYYRGFLTDIAYPIMSDTMLNVLRVLTPSGSVSNPR